MHIAKVPTTDSTERLTVGRREAAKMLGISERLLWTLTSTGEVPHMRIGTRVLYPVEPLRKWVAARAGTST